MTPKCIYVAMAIIFAVLAACSGTMQGVVRKDARRVVFDYSDSKMGTADVQVVMPGGERFEGRVERGTDRTRPNSSSTISTDRFEAVETFGGNADAVLSGNRGNIMKCRFHLTDVIIGFSGHGIGICQLADGRVIDIFF
jgi:hypothetical protein